MVTATAASPATTGVAAGRPQPQTTVEAPGGPFIRHSQDGRRSQYIAQPSFGGLVANPMVASPGYNKGYRLKVTSTSAGATVATLVVGGDGVFPVGQLVTLKDAFGTPIIVAPGFHAFYLIPMLSGQFGVDETQDISALPSFTQANTTNGGFQFSTYLPWEFSKAYGLISGANASLLPTLQVNVGPTSSIWSTLTGTTPTLQFQLDVDFYWLPQGVAVEPPGIGTTCQWVLQPCNPTIASGGALNVQLPRLGGYLTTLIFELRNALGLRCTENGTTDIGWPARPRFLVDGVPLIDTDIQTLFDDMAIAMSIGSATGFIPAGLKSAAGTAGTVQVSRPNGVIAQTRKTALNQRMFGLLESGEIFLSTNPGTQIEVAGFPWGTLLNAPATLNALVGQVVPSGQLIQGLPEV
jgi:hypothetical protein